ARGLEPRLLIVEGTRASREDRDESEEMVEENCLRAVSEERGLVVADFGPRNVGGWRRSDASPPPPAGSL
ncbi:MAG TPA: hypothetical protein PKX52_02825, partial [Methanomassiliicoccaceae archaeon]|nr:hypothetical protein [Methanomassiliicoccaceae archaeon]